MLIKDGVSGSVSLCTRAVVHCHENTHTHRGYQRHAVLRMYKDGGHTVNLVNKHTCIISAYFLIGTHNALAT